MSEQKSWPWQRGRLFFYHNTQGTNQHARPDWGNRKHKP
jgi:hypothetical protein